MESSRIFPRFIRHNF